MLSTRLWKPEAVGRYVSDRLTQNFLPMEPSKCPEWFGLLSSGAPTAVRAGAVAHRRTKRNPWIVVGCFGLVFVAWLNSLM